MDRAERRRRTKNVISRRKEVMRWSGMLEWATDRVVGRCRSLHPFDCGQPKCGVCQTSRKWLGKSRQEKRSELDWR